MMVCDRASGLGRATIRKIIEAGGYVSLLDMNEIGGQELVKELGSLRTKFFQADISNTESIAQAVKGTLAWVKETRKELAGVIAAAGVSTPAKIIDRHGDPFDLKGFDFVMSINVRGSIDLVRQLLPHMTKVEPEAPDGERGIIVLVSSSAAYVSWCRVVLSRYSQASQFRRTTRPSLICGFKRGTSLFDLAIDEGPRQIRCAGRDYSTESV